MFILNGKSSDNNYALCTQGKNFDELEQAIDEFLAMFKIDKQDFNVVSVYDIQSQQYLTQIFCLVNGYSNV